MGKHGKTKKKRMGAEKTTIKTDKKLAAKQKKMLEKLGEANIIETVQQLEEKETRLTQIVEVVCSPPSPRSNFSLVAHPEKEELIMFGGEFYNGSKICVYNDLFVYNISRNEWKSVRSPGGPTPRSGHQMVAVSVDGGQLWLFGGEHASPSQLQFYHYKDLWMMNVQLKKWEKITSPNGPSARSGHRMVAAKKRLFIFGGFHDNNCTFHYYNDVHVFSLRTYEWLNIKIEGGVIPAVRSGCCIAASSDGKIFIWGGYSKSTIKKDVDRGITYTDMYVLTMDAAEENKFKWSTVKPGGYRPKPRSGVGCATAMNGKAYCFGGVMDTNENDENVVGEFSSDFLAFDLPSQSWRFLEISKMSKSTQQINEASQMEIVSSKPITKTDGIFTITVGGPSTSTSYVSTIPSLFEPRSAKNQPSPRMNPALCVCKGILYLFGGLYEENEKQLTLMDLYSIDLHKLDEWKVIIADNPKGHDWISSDSSSSDEEYSSLEDSNCSDVSSMDTE